MSSRSWRFLTVMACRPFRSDSRACRRLSAISDSWGVAFRERQSATARARSCKSSPSCTANSLLNFSEGVCSIDRSSGANFRCARRPSSLGGRVKDRGAGTGRGPGACASNAGALASWMLRGTDAGFLSDCGAWVAAGAGPTPVGGGSTLAANSASTTYRRVVLFSHPARMYTVTTGSSTGA